MKLLKVGAILQTMSYAVLSLYTVYESPVVAFLITAFCITVYEVAIGTIAWVYSAEILCVKGLGIAFVVDEIMKATVVLIFGELLNSYDNQGAILTFPFAGMAIFSLIVKSNQ